MRKSLSFLALFIPLLFPLGMAWSDEVAPLAESEVQPVALPGDPLLLKAREALDAGQWRKARRTLKSYIGKNPKSAEGWTLLARTYLATGTDGKARRRFDKALKFDPHYAPAYVGRGELFEKKGRMDEAANDFRAATLADPGDAQAQQALARVVPEPPHADAPGSSVGPKGPSAE